MGSSVRVGYHGVGLMGHGAAKNILIKGYPLTVLGNRSREPVEDLKRRGAKEAKSPAELARDCGVEVVSAGRTFPYGRDPEDSNLRIAPTFPALEEVRQAAEALAACTLLAVTEKLLRERGVND